jgi:hemerythrin-like domain-containing protein
MTLEGDAMSATPIDALRVEHANMRSVLTIIRDQLDVLEKGSVPDYVLLANSVYYMRRFPSLVHHPKEDLIFALLVDADPGLKSVVEHARRDHEEIYALEDWLIETALNAPRPGTHSRQRLEEFGREYLRLQQEHSRREEHELFPRASALLKPKDWAEVARRFKQVDDPVFGRHSGERYELLYEHLMREAERT